MSLPAAHSEISWYHTVELPEGPTAGWVDWRGVVDRTLIPDDLEGMAVLDVGTWDGFWAFELERRGATVTTIDIPDPEGWDWPPLTRTAEREPGRRAVVEETDLGRGFEFAKGRLGSVVDQERINVYDVSPERLGNFDLAVVGSILLHLRDPVRALEAIASVCEGRAILNEAVELIPTLLSPRSPRARLEGLTEVRWWQPNFAAVRAMASSAGMVVDEVTRPFIVPLGSAHPPPPGPLTQLRSALTPAGREHLIAWHAGIPHVSIRCGGLRAP